MSGERRELAWKAHREGDLARAESLYRTLLASQAQADDAVNFGAMLRQQGRLREAGQLYAEWLPRFRDDLQLHLNAANCLHDLNDHQVCAALLRDYLQRHPGERKIEWALARSLSALKEHAEAERLLRDLTSQDSADTSSWLELGLCLYRQEKRSEALQCFERVNDLDPKNAIALSNRITMLKDGGRFEACRQLIATLTADLREEPIVRGAIATMHIAATDPVAAMEGLVPLCEAEPSQAGHWLNLASSLRSLKRANTALKVLKRGLTWAPNDISLQQALGQCLAELGRPEHALPVLLRSAGSQKEIKDDHLFNLQFLGAGYHLIPPVELRRWAQDWEARLLQDRGLQNLWADAIREPIDGRRLRVGYLSADWCNHPVCRFMLPILRHHDREKVEVWGLCSTPHQDALHERAKQACEHWLDLRHATDLEAARVISDLKLDVVVELGGYTGHSRLAALIQRAAPVQLSYLGYPAPTYLRALNGWIGDDELFGGLDPIELQSHQLWKVRGGYMAYEPDMPLAEPRRRGNQTFRFGCFNHSRKLNPATATLFASVLRAVPESELVLKSISFIEPEEKFRVHAMMLEAGLESERLVLLEATDRSEDHLLLYEEMDAALDPIPYGGATTTCEALIMGVPVVSMAGAGMVGRLSCSVLRGAGLEGWIASDAEDYVFRAQQLALEGPRSAAERAALRQRVLGSDLCDPIRLSRELERIYREACCSTAVV